MRWEMKQVSPYSAFGRFRRMERSGGELRRARRRCAARRLLESTRKINVEGKNSAERRGKPDDSEELGSFGQIGLLYIYNTDNKRTIDEHRGWPPDASSNDVDGI